MNRVRRHFAGLLAVLVFAAVAAAPLGAALAQPCPMMAAAGAHHSPDGTMPDCGHDMACIVMVALPACAAPATGPAAWATVLYWFAAVEPAGVIIAPDPSPPKPNI